MAGKKRSGLANDRRAYGCSRYCPITQLRQVVPTTYIVEYNGNGSTGGTVPTDGSSPYTAGSTVTVLGKGSLIKTGYTFANWNTAVDGTGISYSPTNTFTINANTILYAQWTFIPFGPYTLTYNGNDGTGSPPAPTRTYLGGYPVEILDNTFTRTSFLFGGWNTVTVYGIWGLYYPAGSTLTMPYADTILYAQWYNPTGTNYQVIYDGNGSESGTPPATVNYKLYQGVSITGNTGSLARSGFTLYGWNTSANGLGTAYPVPVTSNGFTMPAQNVTLYAQWVITSVNYTLTYDGNGNTGGTVPTATSYPAYASVNVILNAPIDKTGYTFLGWSTAADGSGTNYSTGDSIVMNSNKLLYAQWVGGVLAKSCFATGTFQSGWSNWGSKDVYRDNTNNKMTTYIQTLYSNASGAPYGTGNSFADIGHVGNILNSYIKSELYQALDGVYNINTIYKTNWTGQSESNVDLISLASPYWPTTQTIQDITITTTGFASFVFSTNPYPPTSPVTTVPGTGCTSVSVDESGILTNSAITAFYINFSNGTTTRVAIGIQTRWDTTTNPYTLTFNRARVEIANGPTPSPISDPFTPTNSAAVNVPLL